MTFRQWIKNITQGVTIVFFAVVAFSLFYLFGFIAFVALLLLGLFYPPRSSRFKRYAYDVAISLDQLANTFIFGNPDQTVSGRLGYAIYYKNKNNKLYVIICKILSKFFGQNNHCLDAIEFDRIEDEK